MGKYKKKNCKFCGTEHNKRGPYCSQRCSAFDREPTDRMREKMRQVATEYNKTPEAIAQQKMLTSGITPDEFAVTIPDTTTLDDFYDFTEGFDRAEKW